MKELSIRVVQNSQKLKKQMGSVYFPILYDHTNNQEKFQVPRISLNTAPRFSNVTIIDYKVENGKMTKWQ